MYICVKGYKINTIMSLRIVFTLHGEDEEIFMNEHSKNPGLTTNSLAKNLMMKRLLGYDKDNKTCD